MQSGEINSGFYPPFPVIFDGRRLVRPIRFNIGLTIKPSANQMSLPVTCPAIRDLNNPYFGATPGRFEHGGLAEQVKEALQHHVLGFPGIAQNPESNAKHQPRITVEK